MSHLFLSGCHILCIEIICLSSYVITAVYFPPVYALITLLSPTASIEAESCASFKVSSIYRNSSLLNILTADSNTSSSNEYLKKKAVHFILSSFALFWSLHLPFSVQIQDISFSPLPSHMQVLILSLSPEVFFLPVTITKTSVHFLFVSLTCA